MAVLRVGHSPDPDDAFMFFAFAKEKVTIEGYTIEHVMEDIESLNRRAMEGELDMTAISAAVYPQVADKYRIMACGASVGRNYGPMLICKDNVCLEDLANRRIGIPGSHTTAYLLFRLYMTEGFQPVMLPFDSIMDALDAYEIDAGVIIHEGQLTWKEKGLFNILDLGKAWMEDTGLPIPLGLDVLHRRLSEDHPRITHAMEESIRYARANEEPAIDYALEFGRGIDRDTCREFVKMYVNDDTENMGDEGLRALETLYGKAAERGILTAIPRLDIIGLK